MTKSPRLLLIAVGAILFSAGCMFRRDPVVIPRVHPPTENRGGKTGFAELQQNTESTADNKVRGQGTAQNDSRGVRRTSWENQGNDGDQRPVDDVSVDRGVSLPPGDNTSIPSGPRPGADPMNRAEPLHQPRNLQGNTGNGTVRPTPTVLGKNLQLGPQELAAERAVLLAQMLDQSQAEGKILRERVTTLEQQIDTLKRTRPDLTSELEQATEELRKSRLQMEALHGEVATLRERLRRLDKQELDTLQEVIVLLEQMAQDTSPKKPGR